MSHPTKSCALSFQAGRPDFCSYFLSTCQYLPESDRISSVYVYRVHQVTDIEDIPEYETAPSDEDILNPTIQPHEHDHSVSHHTVSMCERHNISLLPSITLLALAHR